MAFWPRTEIWKEVFKQRCLGQEKGTIPQLQSQLFNNNIIYMQKTSESLQNWSQWSKGDIRASEVQTDIEIRNPGCSSAAVVHQNSREQNRGLTVPGELCPRSDHIPQSHSSGSGGRQNSMVRHRSQLGDRTSRKNRDIFKKQAEEKGMYIDRQQEVPNVHVGLT